MQVFPSTFTVAEYCQQMLDGQIIVNRDYQRTSEAWPTPARSYLIDTILNGYPMPKFALYQKTDLKSRRTVKEIVDGQQRSKTILDFFEGKLRIAGRANLFSGSRLNQLEEEYQQKFLAYQLTVDLYVGATDIDIRQVFRRMNSYTVPLNDQEKRHASYQGDFKWFIAGLSEKYSEMLKDIGVFSEGQLSRMADASLFSEIIYALMEGIESSSKAKLDKLYADHDDSFDSTFLMTLLSQALDRIMDWPDIFNGPLMKSYNFYCLILAICHVYSGPLESLDGLYSVQPALFTDKNTALVNLTKLAEAVEGQNISSIARPGLAPFVYACSGATNQRERRLVRFQYFCRALVGANLS